jgi:outer membrane biogenesis lipoprotein LolB
MRLCIFGLVVLLSACAAPMPMKTLKSVDSKATTLKNESMYDKKNTVHAWRGRIAVRVDSKPIQQFNAHFSLEGSPISGDMQFSNMLGTVLGEISWQERGASWRNIHGVTSYPSLTMLTQDVIGTNLPMDCLFSWLQHHQCHAPSWQIDLGEADGSYIKAIRTGPDYSAQLVIILDH